MKLKTPILFLIIVAILAGFGLFFVNSYRNKTNKAVVPPQKTEPVKIVKENVSLDLYLEPEQKTAKVGDDVNFLVKIDTNKLILIATETYLKYDPNIISIDSIQPGTVFTSPNILLNKIDPQLGKISYALGTFQPAPSNGLLFTISGKILAMPAKGVLDLALDKNATKIGLQSPTNSKLYAPDEIQVQYHESQMTIAL